MCAVLVRINTDTGDPTFNNSGILPGRQMQVTMYATRKQIHGGIQCLLLDPCINCLSGLLSQLKLNRPTGFLLHHHSMLSDVTAINDVADLQGDKITTA